MRQPPLLRSIVIVFGALLAMAPALATAQASPPPAGVTVVGVGRAAAPADTATVQLYLSDPTAMYGPPAAPQADATPGAAEREASQPVVSAITGTGIAEGDIEVIVPPYLGNQMYGPYGPSSAIIEFAVQSPDTENLREVLDAAVAGAAGSGQMVSVANIVFTLNDCSQLIQDARQAAFDDASRKADVQANVMGVSLGDPVASRDYPYGPMMPVGTPGDAPEESCSSSSQEVGFYGPTGPTPFDVTADPGVTVSSMLEVTFEVNNEATPAS